MEITIPIRGPVIMPIKGLEYDFLDREYRIFLKEVKKFGHNKSFVELIDDESNYQNIDSIEFKVLTGCKELDNEPEKIKKLRIKHPNLHTPYINEFLIIFLKFNKEFPDHGIIPFIVNRIIKKISLLVNLSYATKVDFLNGLIYSIDGKYIGRTEIILNTLDSAYEHSAKMNWPRLKSVDFKKTIEWFKNNNLHTDGISKNKLQRAINAFSYLFSNLHEQDSSHLFWNMLGIEALLAEGTSNISNQIKIKSALILGEPQEYKKKINNLYNYRSRFVHGNFDFPAKFSSDFDVFEDEYWDYLSFASSILIGLIHKLIENNKNEFEFEYRLIN